MKYIPVFLLLVFFSDIGFAQPELEFIPVSLSGPGLSQPCDITGSGDGSGRLFVVEKRGTIRIIQDDEVRSDFFLNIQTQVINSGERGLLGLAFHPRFPDSPYIYVNYVIVGTITNRISRFTVNPDNPNDALETSEVELLTQTGVQTNHKAGDLAFGPDGYLYVGFGDGGGGGDPINAGQDNDTLLGKIVRIDVDSATSPLPYSIPADNPFVNKDGRDEIWANGIRNPWRISFDRKTGDFWIGDVGQNLWEEVDMVPAGTPGGLNFGWDCKEGNHDYEPGNCDGNTVFTWPVFEYPHSCNPCPNGRGASLTGGFVYRGKKYPALDGYYICADYVSNYYWMIKQTGSDPLAFDVITKNGNGKISELVSFGEDDNGELYACNLNGILYALSTPGLSPMQWGDIIAYSISTGNRILWNIEQIPGIVEYSIERSSTGGFETLIDIASIEHLDDQSSYSFLDPLPKPSAVYYRIAAYRTDGAIEYSPIAKTFATVEVRPNLVFDRRSRMWRLQLPETWRNGEATVYDLQGKEVYKLNLGADQQVDLTPPITPGCYFVKVRSEMGIWAEQVVW